METITARSEILQKLLPLYDGSATGQQNFYQVNKNFKVLRSSFNQFM